MNEPERLTVPDVVGLHREQLAIFGGPEGIRDQGLLEKDIRELLALIRRTNPDANTEELILMALEELKASAPRSP